MAKRASVDIDTRILDGIIKHLDDNVGDGVARVAFAVQGRARVAIQTMEAIDTGALLNSVAVSMRDNSDVKKAQAAARARNLEVETVDLPVPDKKHVAHVGPTVEYGEEVHNGTSRMAGRPFLLQAIRGTYDDMKEAMGKAVRNAK